MLPAVTAAAVKSTVPEHTAWLAMASTGVVATVTVTVVGISTEHWVKAPVANTL